MSRASYPDSLVREGKMFAFLSYIPVACVIPLIFKKENPFVLQHGKQGLVLFVSEVAVFVLHIILGVWFLRLGLLVFGLLSCVGMIHTIKGQAFRIFFIDEIAQKIVL